MDRRNSICHPNPCLSNHDLVPPAAAKIGASGLALFASANGEGKSAFHRRVVFYVFINHC